MSSCEIVAHRGASYDAPENTLASFRLAWEQGVKVVEGDFRLTSDSRIVCFHDSKTDRIGGGSREIEKMTFDEVRAMDVGSWKGEAWAGEQVPTLEKILEEMPNGNLLFVEIKCGPELVELLEGLGVGADRIKVMSFREDVVSEAVARLSGVDVYWLTRYKKKLAGRGVNPDLKRIMEVLDETGASGLGSKRNDIVDAEFVRVLHDAGKAVNVWTVDDPAEAGKYIEAGVDFLTTNRPMYVKNKI